MRLLLLCVLMVFCFSRHNSLQAQYLPQHINNEGIYDFLDEMANLQLITLASVARPYSHAMIRDKLDQVGNSRFVLTSRQRYMFNLYRLHYSPRGGMSPWPRQGLSIGSVSALPPGYGYHDGAVHVTARPILEGHYHSNTRGDVTHIHGGAAVTSYAGDSWSAWASLQSIRQRGEMLARPGMLHRHEGGTWAHDDIPEEESSHAYNDIRGGVAYSWGWGSVAFQKEHLTWGDHYHGPNILDMRHNHPSYPMVALQLSPGERFRFNYHHGWLNSMVVDSTSVVDFPDHPPRYDYYNKYFAANLFTFMPLEGLHLSAGNSIVYSAGNMYIGNFIPFMVFRAMEPTQAASEGVLNNPSAFINISSRQIRHLHLYASWYANSFKFERLGDSERRNFTSAKGGFRLSGWPIANTDFTLEYTRTLPKTYDHRTPIITYEHKDFSLGHYLGPNATDLYASIGVKPVGGLEVRLCYNDAQKGNLYPHVYGGAQDTDPFMEEVVWRNRTFSLEARYTLYNNIGVYARVRHTNVEGFDVDDYSARDYLEMFSPDFYHGETTTLSFGIYLR